MEVFVSQSRSPGGQKYSFSLSYNQIPKKTPKKPKTPWMSWNHSAVENSARRIWAQRLPRFNPSAENPLQIHVDDIPLMEKVFFDNLSKEQMRHIKFTGLKQGEFDLSQVDFYEFLLNRKMNLVNRLATKKGGVDGKPLSQQEIASIVNVKNRALNGHLVTGPQYPIQQPGS